ncbi:MAG: selenobiotic family peptide radical SAM maturase [Sedimentisphaerales bacterium]|nr:selenobiotic family peptide radical SAM maturase [Sedimentisphaerales bacterium]
MNTNDIQQWNELYPVTSALLDAQAWEKLTEHAHDCSRPINLADKLLPEYLRENNVPQYLTDLLHIEWCRYQALRQEGDFICHSGQFEINPTLDLIQTQWSLSPCFTDDGSLAKITPRHEGQWMLIWKDPETSQIRTRPADDGELLAIKIAVDQLDIHDVASEADVSVGSIYMAQRRAAREGLLLAPPSKIRRNRDEFPADQDIPQEYLVADTFTLQWHITQACDLHCRHCYDRSKRSPLTLEQGYSVLDNLVDFCIERNVWGHVCFTGGNPFMYPDFFELYRGAAQRGFSTSILGNPVSREKLRKLIDIKMPGYFQVSLEGLQEYNNYIRGNGHFCKTLEFLDLLREMNISSAVMLTLNKDNMDQVLPLAELLRDRTDSFTFNRLSPVGQGADLLLPEPSDYAAFLSDFVDASQTNPTITFKDNLINIELNKRGLKPFDGCTGFGCGAAFNFLAVLPDGQTHACRKFPSPVGNVLESTIAHIYNSHDADSYRHRPAACQSCHLRTTCGGCFAVTRGYNLNITTNRDPHCFICGYQSIL